MKEDYSQILIDIQKKSRITVENIKDLKNLKEEVESHSDVKIGFNTLRRLFGFLPKTVPSKNTLNLLSNYLGFASYSNYINNKLNFDEWYFQQKLINLQFENRIDTNSIETINNGLTNTNNIVAVANFVAHFIQQKNTKALTYIFNSLQFPNLNDGESLKFATIVSYHLLNIKKNEALEIYKQLIPVANFRNLVTLYYIDYTNLVGLYGDVLLLTKQISNQSSDLFFVKLMLFYKDYFQNKKTTKTELISIPNDFNTFHHVLKGRYLAYLILKSNAIDEDLEKHILHEIRKNQVSLISQEVIPALIVKEEYTLLSVIFEKHYEELFETTSWSYKTSNSINLIGMANVNWHQKNYASAKNNLALVELDKVELGYYAYFSLFYYLTQLKLSFSENDLINNKFAQSEITKFSIKTKFSIFDSLAKNFVI